MIRDPSDGSVRDKPKVNPVLPVSKPVPTKEQVRLERSRCWLKDYQQRKGYPQKSEEAPPSGLPD